MNKTDLILNEHGEHEEREFIYSPLWWHEKGLQQTATGYGSKLITPYKVHFEGKLRRVYAICFSNVAGLYIMLGTNRRHLGV